MTTSVKYKEMPKVRERDIARNSAFSDYLGLVRSCFRNIAPVWPLENLIAVNPLQGFEDLSIEDALKIGVAYFEQSDLPKEMSSVNIETIKWLGVYCDEGQATLTMPLRKDGLYHAWAKLAPYDEKLHKGKKNTIDFLKNLPKTPDEAISKCLIALCIPKEKEEEFLTLLLTTLPGWAGYIKYKTEWEHEGRNSYKITQVDYLAVRILITTLLWPQAKTLLYTMGAASEIDSRQLLLEPKNDFLSKLGRHKKSLVPSEPDFFKKLSETENSYRHSLLRKIANQKIKKRHTPKAQLVFCIDVRSEPFRKSLESTGDYQTFGFAGFFGVPVTITDKITGRSYSSCPVLLKPKHEIFEEPSTIQEGLKYKSSYDLTQVLKRLYQSLKYTFVTPFVLVEALGGLSALWMGIRTISPRLASKIRAIFSHNSCLKDGLEPSMESISFQEKCAYAENALRMMGLTNHFAPVVVFCGHGSTTENNAYSTALDCGACGGRHGGSNAKILAAIMNCPEVKSELRRSGIHIPETTKFVAAEHNTTTDEVVLFCDDETEGIQKLKQDLLKAGKMNNEVRLKKLGVTNYNANKAQARAYDWAQVRPEWGLAGNAAFIVAPRDVTSSIDLQGRCFLHSYDYEQDPEGVFLTTILTAPMIVAQWINMHYLFSTMNNIAYGGGSKITKNITAKIGIMQGNASDLMNGLPLQSVYSHDTESYHEPQRLISIVRAPRTMVDKIISAQSILQKLFGNGWVQMAVIEPNDDKIYLLNREFVWEEMK